MAAISALQVQRSLIIVEFLLMMAGFIVLLPRKSAGRSPFPPWFYNLARKKKVAVLLTGLLVLGSRSVLIPILGVPRPQWHDEFSYLLAADTFAHGRLTNPTPPEWQHFETFHVILEPTYMSIYPPAQGLVLAAGQVLGHPWIGQLLITAAMCSAICWMLQGWLPPAWALLGGFLAVLRLGILSYWTNGFWSASVVAFAGALLVGALPRLKRRPTVSDTLWMAAGIMILANSRPYEGLVLSIAAAGYLVHWLLSPKRPNSALIMRRLIVPALIALAAGAIGTGYYYHRVTGNAFRMTYEVDQKQYASVPFFLFQSLQPEHAYRHEILRTFYENDRRSFEDLQTGTGFLRQSAMRFANWWNFYFGPLLTIPLLALPWMVRNRRVRFALLTLACMLVALSVSTWFLPHYFAPATALLYLVLVQGLRHISHVPYGSNVVRWVLLVACSMVLLRIIAVVAHAPLEPRWPRGNLQRANLVSELNRLPGAQIVIVRYSDSHDPVEEWVYNSADLPGAKIVWARDMGTRGNNELLARFSDRQAWIVQPDASPVLLQPYRP
ncbi:MAG TPA: hypothetical protein VFA68_12290 [Terriglobales bacterium]|nr:hypothetical protein [Terriglobales bacterium]